MKNLILALTVLLTTQIPSQEKFNTITYAVLEDGRYRDLLVGPDKTSGEIYYTSLPDTVIKNPDFNGHECIIVVYDTRRDDVDFFPIRHKVEYTDSTSYYCYNARVDVEFIHNVADGTYTALFITTEAKENSKMKFHLEK
jgi:hypothetical protein